MTEFIEKILQILRTNGFPEKRVSLPTEKMYEAADTKGFSFNQVLERLKSEHGVEAKVGAEKIIFSRLAQEDLIKQAQDMMAQMDPEELRRMQAMFESMSPEQKEELFRKGKDLGLI